MANLSVLHGPNLSKLGSREPEIYGRTSLTELNQRLLALATELGHTLTCQQSNAEHELIDAILNSEADLIIFNPAAYTHTSVALRDALTTTKIPFIEVHLSNIYTREIFRQHSYFSDIAVGVISGLGVLGYEFALKAAHHHLQALSGVI